MEKAATRKIAPAIGMQPGRVRRPVDPGRAALASFRDVLKRHDQSVVIMAA
jgi:hypothetical protein